MNLAPQCELPVSAPLLTKSSEATAQVAYRVGGVSVELSAPANLPIALDPEMRSFIVEPGGPDIRVRAAWADDLEFPETPRVFASGGLWSLFEEAGGYRFCFFAP